MWGEVWFFSRMQRLNRLFPFVLAFSIIISLASCATTQAAPPSAPIPAAKRGAPLAAAPGKQTAIFAGGCFWGTQSVFERVKGVVKTTAGYSGGAAKTATYDQVTTETTGHVESVEVVYDPSKITCGQLLRIFFSVVHDPTQVNRQGPDVGTSYRSAIFYTEPMFGFALTKPLAGRRLTWRVRASQRLPVPLRIALRRTVSASTPPDAPLP
jgi:peptide-methionine (S)-S-oxide reductase